jgi:hypothetical protein
MPKHPNYTFSISDKQLYTLFKGITVSPLSLQRVFAQASPLYTRRPLSLLRTTHFTRPTCLRVTTLLRQSPGHRSCRTFGADTDHDASTTKLGPWGALRDPFSPVVGAHSTRGVPDPSAPSTPKACWLRRHRGNCTYGTTLTWFKQC